MNKLSVKPDSIGAMAGSLCLLHCLSTPFFFIAQACSVSCCEATPIWWQWVDYIFLTISFVAVYRSTQTTSRSFIKPALWLSWSMLFVVIINEKLQWISLPEASVYIVAFTLIALHLYNLKYCQCKTENCCTNHE